jgi:uncharacterized membrane protein YphA (DoxX/SURF4 family)
VNLSRWIFLRLVGVSFAIAFVSLWVQADGLIGREGVLPIADTLANVRRAGLAWTDFPTLFWLDDSDRALHLVAGAGVVVSVLVVAGVLTRASLVCAWALYLSLVLGGSAFLAYQWDVLLLETAVVAFLVAPGSVLERPGRDRPPGFAAVLLLRVLLFKLVFLSGWVKLGDEVWRDGTALEFHYWTQPLPTPPAWYAHQLPSWFHRLSVWVLLAIELGAPFLLFGPRLARHAAAAAIAVLMVLIGLTGNYNFFNLLTVALCVACVDDRALRRLLPRRLGGRAGAASESPSVASGARRRRRALMRLPGRAAALFLAAWSLVVVVERAFPDAPLPALYADWRDATQRWFLCNGYGLFANMTTERREITLEGSRDGVTWRPYRFRWKPEQASRAPRFVEPHQPRLDWDLWFAALRTWDRHPTFPALCLALLRGRAPVEALFEEVPFANGPPKFLRATARSYRFTTRAERAASGDVWKLGEPVPYAPVLGLSGDKLVRY